jgi:hypothetical protein
VLSGARIGRILTNRVVQLADVLRRFFRLTVQAISRRAAPDRGDGAIFGILKIKLIEAMRGLKHMCMSVVVRDDDEDAGDICTPEPCREDEF